VYANCTKVAASKRRKQILDSISIMRKKRQDVIGSNLNYFRLLSQIFLINFSLFVEKLKVTDFGQISNFPFLVSKTSKIDSNTKKINKLNYCQYCNYINNNGGNFSRHYNKQKILEYKKEIEKHLDEVTNVVSIDFYVIFFKYPQLILLVIRIYLLTRLIATKKSRR
jgi:hypothetical protein